MFSKQKIAKLLVFGVALFLTLALGVYSAYANSNNEDSFKVKYEFGTEGFRSIQKQEVEIIPGEAIGKNNLPQEILETGYYETMASCDNTGLLYSHDDIANFVPKEDTTFVLNAVPKTCSFDHDVTSFRGEPILQRNDTVIYTITVKNQNGGLERPEIDSEKSSMKESFILEETLPDCFDYSSARLTGTHSKSNLDTSTGKISIDCSELINKQIMTVHITAKVKSDATGSIYSVSPVTTSSNMLKQNEPFCTPRPANITVIAPKLEMTKDVNNKAESDIEVGQSFTYSFTLANSGDQGTCLYDVTLSDNDIPDGVFVDDATMTLDERPVTPVVLGNRGEFKLNVGDIQSGERKVVSVEAKLSKGVSANMLNTATAGTSQAPTTTSHLYYGVLDNVLYISGVPTKEATIQNDKALTGSRGWGKEEICNSVTEVVIQNEVKPSDMNRWFQNFVNCTRITGLDKVNTVKCKDMSYLFFCCDKLESVDISNFDTSSVTNMQYMFYSCKSLTSLDVSSFDTSNVTKMEYMFYLCSSLASLDLSNFDTSNVSNMEHMFHECKSLVSLDVSSFDTSNVALMGAMFYYCSKLTDLDVSNFDTSKVTNMLNMFSDCKKVASLDVSDFNTSRVTDMSGMFCSCESVKALDVSNFDTSNTTDIGNMFRSCSLLTSLDLSSFNTSNVKSTMYMFYYCSNLTTIYASTSFDVSKVTSDSSMFQNTTKLVGGSGTIFDKIHTGKEYARIDQGPESDAPGYFTEKNSHAKVSAQNSHEKVSAQSSHAEVSASSNFRKRENAQETVGAISQEEPKEDGEASKNPNETKTASATIHPTFNITTDIQNGSITPKVSGISFGASQTINYEPQKGYQVVAITVDGKKVPIDEHRSSYTFGDIKEHHDILVVCKEVSEYDLTVSNDKSVLDSDYFQTGDEITYRVFASIKDEGSYDDNVLISDIAPKGLTFVSATSNLGNVSWDGSKASCLIDKLTAEDEVEMVIKAKVKEDADVGTIKNIVAISGRYSGETASECSVYVVKPILSISKVTDKEVYHKEDTIKFEIEVSNIVENTRDENITITDTDMSKGITIDASSVKSSKGVVIPKENGFIVSDVSLKGKEKASVSFDAKVDNETVESSQLVNTAKAKGKWSDEVENSRPIKFVYRIKTQITNGTITPPVDNIQRGDSMSITYSPDEGYYIDRITVDGQPVLATDYRQGFAFENIEDDHAVEVICAKIPGLILTNKTDKDEYFCGDTVYYTVIVKQGVSGATSSNVVITDVFDKDGYVVLNRDSVKIFLNDKDFTDNCNLTLTDSGFTCITGKSLMNEDSLVITFNGQANKEIDKLDNTAKGTCDEEALSAKGDVAVDMIDAEKKSSRTKKIDPVATSSIVIKNPTPEIVVPGQEGDSEDFSAQSAKTSASYASSLPTGDDTPSLYLFVFLLIVFGFLLIRYFRKKKLY